MFRLERPNHLGIWQALLGVLCFALAGCLGSVAPKGSLIPEEASPWISMGQDRVSGSLPLFWNGTSLPYNNLSTMFSLTLPPDFWADNRGGLEVSIVGEGFPPALRVFDSQARLIGSDSSSWFPGWYARVVLIPEPTNGDYEIRITSGGGPERRIDGVIQVESRPRVIGPASAEWPDLIALTPEDLGTQEPRGTLPPSADQGVEGRIQEALGIRGCKTTEHVSSGAKRCLRFTTSVGNIGEGPLEVRLSASQGALSPAGMSHFQQRVWMTDGSFEDRSVGEAFFHAAHGHFHYEGLAAFALYKYDNDTKTRGDVVGEGRKAGFCLLDAGLIELGMNGTKPHRFGSWSCLSPANETEWFMGVSPNWFDEYNRELEDQFVDIDGLPDGTYELEVDVNSERTLLESNYDNNRASLVFEMRGDRINELFVP